MHWRRKACSSICCGQGIVICTTIDRMVFSPNDDPKVVLTNLIISLLVMVRANEESQTKSNRLKDVWAGFSGNGPPRRASG